MNGNNEWKQMNDERKDWMAGNNEWMTECANNERMNEWRITEWRQWVETMKLRMESRMLSWVWTNEESSTHCLRPTAILGKRATGANWAYRHKVCHGAIQFFFLFWNLLWQAVGFLSSTVVIIIVVVIRVIAWTVEMTSCLSNRNDKLVPEQ